VLSDELGIPQPTTSHHLGVLRDAGLVVARRDGRATVYALTDGALSQAVALLVVSESPEM
jgi:DNA-binding transcriptional ArsR family regulator